MLHATREHAVSEEIRQESYAQFDLFYRKLVLGIMVLDWVDCQWQGSSDLIKYKN